MTCSDHYQVKLSSCFVRVKVREISCNAKPDSNVLHHSPQQVVEKISRVQQFQQVSKPEMGVQDAKSLLLWQDSES